MATAKAFGIAGFALSREQRIEQLILGAGGHARVAELLQVSRQTLYNWVKPGAKLPFNDMVELARLNGVSTDWIATGYDRRPELPPLVGGSMTVVYRYEVSPSGQVIEIADHGDDIAFRDEWLERLDIAPAHAGLLAVRGDAMSPTIRAGATLIVDRKVSAIRDAGIYAVLLAKEIEIRRAQVMRDGGVKLSADNPHYQPEMVPESEVKRLHVVGRVRAAFISV